MLKAVRGPVDDLRLTDDLVLAAELLSYSVSRSSGPGGQNVNKVSSKVDLRFDLLHSKMPGPIKARLRAMPGVRMDREGRVQIVCQETRDQKQNLQKARARLRELILSAMVPPKRRKATKPSRGAKRRRLEGKQKLSEKKKGRKKVDW